MKQTLILEADFQQNWCILTNDKGDTFEFDPNTKNGEELADFLSGCKEIDIRTDVQQAPQNIKDELIKMGWSENLKDSHIVYKNYNGLFITYSSLSKYIKIKNGETIIKRNNVTLDRIKALVFGLTGEEM